MILEFVLILLIIASWIYWIVALGWTWEFFRTPNKADLKYKPPVSILKPLKGLDAQAYQNFASFCRQEYPDYELLFGVADPADPAIEAVARLQRDYPGREIRLLVIPAIGTNHKASLLHALANQARHEVLVISDSDMRVTPDYLKRVVAPLADEGIGLVTCPYRGELPLTLTARLEALYMGVTFLPSVIVGRKVIKMRFAMGATSALRRQDLNRLGGFASFADYLADDYQLGVRIAKLGLRVCLSDYVVASVLGATTFKEQMDREVRWAHCNRISRPWEYPGLLLSFSTPLAAILLLLSAFAPLGWWMLLASLGLRWVVGWWVAGLSGDEQSRRWIAWLPVRDMLSAIVWFTGLVGRRVVWRDEEFIILPDGRLKAPSGEEQHSLEAGSLFIVGKALRGLDALLQKYYHIIEFSDDEDCLLRLSIGINDREVVLSDGTRVLRNEAVGELHFWNEHIPEMPRDGPDLAWARAFHQRVNRSMAELAAYVETTPDLQDILAFRADMPFGSREDDWKLDQMVARWGFEIIRRERSDGLWHRFAGFWKNIYAVCLILAFNPGSLRGKGLIGMQREDIWISRRCLNQKYGAREVRS